jgi:hypothetical protein
VQIPDLVGKSREEVKTALKKDRGRGPRRRLTNRNRTSQYHGVGKSNRKGQWQARILIDKKVRADGTLPPPHAPPPSSPGHRPNPHVYSCTAKDNGGLRYLSIGRCELLPPPAPLPPRACTPLFPRGPTRHSCTVPPQHMYLCRCTSAASPTKHSCAVPPQHMDLCRCTSAASHLPPVRGLHATAVVGHAVTTMHRGPGLCFLVRVYSWGLGNATVYNCHALKMQLSTTAVPWKCNCLQVPRLGNATVYNCHGLEMQLSTSAVPWKCNCLHLPCLSA